MIVPEHDLPLAKTMLAMARAHNLKIRALAMTAKVTGSDKVQAITAECLKFEKWLESMEQELWPKTEKS